MTPVPQASVPVNARDLAPTVLVTGIQNSKIERLEDWKIPQPAAQ